MRATSIAGQADSRTSEAQPQDELRARLRRLWSEVAEGWGERAEEVDSNSAPVTARLLEVAAPSPGDRVLELACGPGGAGIAAAERVAPDGTVTFSDISVEMTEIALARAAARGLANVTACVRDLEQIGDPDESYDVVLCREGLMLVPDPARAVREIRRVLRRGGRIAVAVWGPRDRNPWLAVMFDAISAELGCPVPPTGIPGPFSLEDAEKLASLLLDAELSDVVVSEVPIALYASSFDAWWDGRRALAGPLTQILASLPADKVEAMRARAREAAKQYASPRGLQFPGIALVASGCRG
jgi:SAM-dependent methyltransferase